MGHIGVITHLLTITNFLGHPSMGLEYLPTFRMKVWKMIFLFNWVTFRFHVNFQGVYRGIPSLKTNSKFAPENRPKLPQKEMKLVFQPSIFRGKLLVSGRVNLW